MLSSAEYYALADVEQAEARRWAASQAMAINLHLSSDEEPFLPDDFLGLADRTKRIEIRLKGRMDAAILNRKLTVMKPARPGEAVPDYVPEWAREAKK